ncbi:MAG: 7-cyano-7-deazaguanine synthase QueC [Pseudomonadota bacterium]
MTDSALVLFSGGQDSTTCLAWALSRYERVETIGFDYGQKHSVEMVCREKILRKIGEVHPNWKQRLGEDHRVDLSVLGQISQTALTQDMAITIAKDGLPNTFVPGRNLLFLTFAAAVAYRRGIRHLVGGMCETDFSGYPDCRDDTIKSMQVTLNLGMDKRFVIDTPLMWLDKADTWRLAADIGGENLFDLIVEDSHTCYTGDRSKRHTWGYGCGTCPACVLRANGFEKYNNQPSSIAGRHE